MIDISHDTESLPKSIPETGMIDIAKALVDAPKHPAKYVGSYPKGLKEAVTNHDCWWISLYFSDPIDYSLFEETARSMGYKTEVVKRTHQPSSIYHDQHGNKVVSDRKPSVFEELEVYKEENIVVGRYPWSKKESKTKKRTVYSLYLSKGSFSNSATIHLKYKGGGKFSVGDNTIEELQLWDEYRKRRYGNV